MTKTQTHAFDQVLYQFDELTVKVYRNRRKVEQVADRLAQRKPQEDQHEPKRPKKEQRDED